MEKNWPKAKGTGLTWLRVSVKAAVVDYDVIKDGKIR